MMSIDTDILNEYKAHLADRYLPIELMELVIDHFDLSVWDVMELVGEERLMELKFR